MQICADRLSGLSLRCMLIFFTLHFSLFTHAQSDSLRVRPQKTAPETVEDLDTAAVSLHRPDNLKQVAELDSLTGFYRIGTKLGTGGFLNTPILMTPEEYQQWSLRRSLQSFYRRKNQESYESEGKSKFDFSDMNFDLGPAEKIFGPGGVSIKTQGSAELKVGGNLLTQEQLDAFRAALPDCELITDW